MNSQHCKIGDTGAKLRWPRAVAPARHLDYDGTWATRPGFQHRPSGGNQMASAVNAGARLDRLPISSFHYRIFWLVGAGMFFDGYDLYVAGGVLASAIQTKFSTLPQNLQFLSLTFVGMTLGSLITGFVGDKFGRRFTYQINLLIFGLASLAAAFAQDMTQLIVCRFVQGLGPRRRNRGRLFDADRIRAAEDARPLARLHGVPGGGGFPGHRDPRLSDHSDLGLAADVHHRRHRLADRLVSAQEPAGIAALAGIARPHRGSGSLDAIDREGSRGRRRAAAGGDARSGRAGHRIRHAPAADPAAHDRRQAGC